MIMLLFPYLFAFIAIFLAYISIKYYTKPQYRLPPGRLGWPLIGENKEYFSKLKNGNPEKFVNERIAKYASNVFKTSLLGEPMVMLCGAEGNKFLFSNKSKAVQVWYPSSIQKIFPHNRYADESAMKVRKILYPFLRGDALHRYVSIMDTVMKQHLESEWSGEEVTVCHAASRFVILLSCRLLLGIRDHKKVEEFRQNIDDIGEGIASLAINIPGTTFYRAVKASKAMRNEFAKVIKQRKVDLLEKDLLPNNDILSSMLMANDKIGCFMSEFDICYSMIGLLFGSSHTLVSALTSIMMYLAELPNVYNMVLLEQMEILRSKEPNQPLNWEDVHKMRYSWNVACEVMRLRSPSFGGFKEATRDLVYAGCAIPKGWKLHWMTNSTHKNPKYFPDPKKFDASRFEGNGPLPYTFVPFGGGTRMCPGNEYARLVMLVFIHNVVTKFKWEKRIPNEEVFNAPFPRPAQGLPIRLHAHSP